jgi:8-oxo-dGTP diphosphatase
MKRTYPDRPILAVGAAVCRDDDRVLIVRRGNAPSKGVWTVPGGVVRLGERMADAAVREVHEECGIEIEVGEMVEILDNIVCDESGRVRFHYAIVDFAARYVGGVLAINEELLDAAWVTPDQFVTYQVPERAQEVLLKALAIINCHSTPKINGRKTVP